MRGVCYMSRSFKCDQYLFNTNITWYVEVGNIVLFVNIN